MLNCTPQGDSNIFSVISATGVAVTIKALLLLGSTNKRESFECEVFRPSSCKSSTRFTIFQKNPRKLKKAGERWRSSLTGLVVRILKAPSPTISTA